MSWLATLFHNHFVSHVLAVGNQREGMIVWVGIVGEESTGADTGRLVDLRKREVDREAVGKLPLAVHTALVKKIHNPHLVIRQNRLVGEGTEKHSAKGQYECNVV